MGGHSSGIEAGGARFLAAPSLVLPEAARQGNVARRPIFYCESGGIVL